MSDDPSNPEEPTWGISATPSSPPPTPAPPPAAPPPGPPPGPPTVVNLPPPPSGPPPAGPPPGGFPPSGFPPGGPPPAGLPPSGPPGGPPGAVPFSVGGGPPPRPPWWKQPWAIVVAILAVVALVGGAIVLLGGDDEGSLSTEETEPDDTDETEPDDTDVSVADTPAPVTTETPETTTTVAPETTTTVAETTTTTEPPPVATPIGTSVTLQGSSESIEATVLAVADPAPLYDFSTPAAGNRALAVQVRAVNTGSVEYLDTGNGMFAIDNAGTAYPSTYLTVALTGVFPLTRLLPGDVRVGWVVFEVPETAPIAQFSWNLDGPSAEAPSKWDLVSAPVAPSATPAPLAATTPFNGPATLTGSTGQVDVAIVSITDNAPQVAGEPPLLPGHRLVAFEIALYNSGTGVFTESPDSFLTLVDANAQWYLTSFLGTTLGAAFPESVALEPGAQLIAYVTVELPVAESPFKLQAALDNGNAPALAELAVA